MYPSFSTRQGFKWIYVDGNIPCNKKKKKQIRFSIGLVRGNKHNGCNQMQRYDNRYFLFVTLLTVVTSCSP